MDFGALRRFGSGVFRRRPLIVPPALERLFIASPVAQGIAAGQWTTVEVG